MTTRDSAVASPGQLGKGRRQAIGAKLENQPLQCAYLLKEELGELWQQDDGRRAWAFPARMARKSHRQRNPSTPGHGKNPPPPSQGNPELLPHRFDQRKDERNQSQDSRFARQRPWLSRRRSLKLRLYALHEAKFTFVG